MREENAIEIRNLTKKFDGFTLQDITLDLPKGCILGLIGENGAGKSTTIRLIMNALKKDRGAVSVLGTDNESGDFSQIKEELGVVLDEAYFPGILSIEEINRIMKYTFRNWDEALFEAYVIKFKLPKRKAFRDFSRGMKMKLSIAAALSHHPRLLLLDEATSGLDPIVRDEILDIFYDFTRDPEHSILISSHILSDLEKLCDYIAFLHEGRLLFCEEKDTLLEKYGIIRCSYRQLEEIPREAIAGRKCSPYGVDCLVKRDMVSPAFTVERAGVEDIILFMAKGELSC